MLHRIPESFPVEAIVKFVAHMVGDREIFPSNRIVQASRNTDSWADIVFLCSPIVLQILVAAFNND